MYKTDLRIIKKNLLMIKSLVQSYPFEIELKIKKTILKIISQSTSEQFFVDKIGILVQ